MASVNLCLAIVAGAGVVADAHGTSKQMTSQIHPESIPRGTPDIVLPVQDFDSTCDWLEKNTLIGYFVGRIPPESMLREWVTKAWSPHGVWLDGFQSLTKGFFLFHFSNLSHVEAILSHGPWSVRSSLLVFQRWLCDFSISDDKKLRVLFWVEFPGLPLP